MLAVFYPIAAPEQPIFNGLGGLAAYTLIFVVVTAWMRNSFEYGFWKKLHYASYGVIVAFLIHGVFTDPSLTPGTPVDYLDGGKIFIEACAVLSLAMIAWRVTIGSRMRRANVRTSAAQVLGALPTWGGTLGVAHIAELPSDVKLFRLVNPEGGALPFDFRAGQYLSVRLNAEDRSVVRNYSICSAPQERNFCEIAVKHIDAGAGSTALHTRIAVGQHLHCAGPDGRFTFSGDEADSIVMIAGGIGVTPLLSVLKDLAARNWHGDVFLLFAVRTPADIVFEDELRSIRPPTGA